MTYALHRTLKATSIAAAIGIGLHLIGLSEWPGAVGSLLASIYIEAGRTAAVGRG